MYVGTCDYQQPNIAFGASAGGKDIPSEFLPPSPGCEHFSLCTSAGHRLSTVTLIEAVPASPELSSQHVPHAGPAPAPEPTPNRFCETAAVLPPAAPPQATEAPQPLYLNTRSVGGRRVEKMDGYVLVTDRVKEAEKVSPTARRSGTEGAARATAAKLRITWKSMMIFCDRAKSMIGVGKDL
ncbi:MAG: hypothetical protein Q9215_002737 [Flavoplaca cf. flavocitrina]